jgi:hypothetical protein
MGCSRLVTIDHSETWKTWRSIARCTNLSEIKHHQTALARNANLGCLRGAGAA